MIFVFSLAFPFASRLEYRLAGTRFIHRISSLGVRVAEPAREPNIGAVFSMHASAEKKSAFSFWHFSLTAHDHSAGPGSARGSNTPGAEGPANGSHEQ